MVYLKDQAQKMKAKHELWLDTAVDVDIDFDEAQQDERALMWVLGWGCVLVVAVFLFWLMLPMISAGMKGGYL